MIMKIRFLPAELLLMMLPLVSGGQTVYSLKDCISIGLEKNFSILVARNSETIAGNNYTKGNAGFLPSLDLSSRFGGTVNNTLQNLTEGGQNKTTGISNTTSNAGVALNWGVFSGFSAHTTYKKLDELKELGELNSQLAVENLVADIISGYYTCIQQVRQLENMKYAVLLSRERLRIDEDRYLLGSSSKLQVLQSRVYLNADSSRLSRQTEAVREAQVRLNEMMAVEDLSVRFITRDSSIKVNPDLMYEKLFEETLNRNTSLLIASKNRMISEYDYKLAVSRSYPYLSLSTGYSYNYNTYQTGQFRNQTVNGLNYGLTLGMNLYDGLNQRRSIKNSALEINNRELRYREIEQGVKADLITIYSAYSNFLRLQILEEQNLQTATENLDIALERYKLGNLSGIELREVQKSLLDANESLLSVQYQAKIAEISLLLISGKIMEYF